MVNISKIGLTQRTSDIQGQRNSLDRFAFARPAYHEATKGTKNTKFRSWDAVPSCLRELSCLGDEQAVKV
jgi:hypothetical protein